MSSPQEPKLWRATIYIRISREDANDILETQQSIIVKHLSMLDNIQICSIKIDDGYSGLYEERPAFQEMLDDIRKGEIDCIAVRDLSRFSRNHLCAGRYIQCIFPSLGVRFISVLEGMDLTGTPEDNVFLMMSFRNLMNEEYLLQLSRNIRNSFHLGHSSGKYMGSFAPYGYQRTQKDRHRLEPDPTTAKVVQDIFKWKLEGWSAASIAERLNEQGVPSPAKYKESSHPTYTTSFTRDSEPKWWATNVIRIFKDRVYTGYLEQGKSCRPHFKLKQRVQKPRDKWICVENTHEVIIPKAQFEAVSRLHQMDTRNSPGKKIVSTLSGFVRCKNCGQNMKLRPATSYDIKYSYYECCGRNESGKPCHKHRISKARLEEKVLLQLRQRMDEVRRINSLIPDMDISQLAKIKKQGIVAELTELEHMLAKTQKRLSGLNDSFILQTLTATDLETFRQHYFREREYLDERIKKAEARLLADISEEELFGWIGQYKPYFTFETITRPMLAYLIDRITVNGDKAVQVEFLHEREFRFIQLAMHADSLNVT